MRRAWEFDGSGMLRSSIVAATTFWPARGKWLTGCSGSALKALVWFWIIDETLVLTSMLRVCRLNEVGTCQVMEQEMIMVMIVMTTR